jgi:uncharacterized SAM-binding protein YcdF (DUF218 family)
VEGTALSGLRLIAVCGYSDGAGKGLHEVCAARLRRAEQEAGPADVVLLTGWARRRHLPSEAELMARSWKAPAGRIVVDRRARSTSANVVAAARLARAVGAERVLLVTSSWHGRRAGVLLRAALGGSGATVRVATTNERPSARTRVRELVSWVLVPPAAAVARLRQAGY